MRKYLSSIRGHFVREAARAPASGGERRIAQELIDRGIAAEGAGAVDEALTCYCKAILADPQFAAGHMNLGIALQAKGELAAAIASHLQAIALDPGYAAAYYNLGLAQIETGEALQAESQFRSALRFRPAFPEAWVGLADTLQTLGRDAEAHAALKIATEQRNDYHEAHSNLIFTLDFLEDCRVEEHQAERAVWYARHGERHAASIQPHANLAEPERRLRVGYVSADFRRHSACSVFAPILLGHDKTAVEVVCYSAVNREDEVTRELRACADEWHSTLGVSDQALAEQIRRERIDILVDLSGHTSGNRLLVFARKPAPVQVTAWGHATGTGLKTIDYFLADPVLVPQEERSLFAEQVFDLPCTLCYAPPQYLPEVTDLPALQGRPFTFGCINRPEKISERVIAVWGRILAQVPQSQLLVKHGGLGDAGVRARLLQQLGEVGIAAQRVRLIGFTPHAEHLKAYHEVDLGLDPFPQNGGVSTAEALWMGVPVVALNGTTIPGRISASILSALGMPQWIAGSDEEYVRIAVQAARELPGLARTRRELRARMAASDFGDPQRYTRAVERAYRQMWRRWCNRDALPAAQGTAAQ